MFKKLSKNYLDKLSLLLYNSVNYRNYFLLRKNLNNDSLYKELENNKQDLTFKKVQKNNNQNKTDLSNNLYQIPEYSNTYSINDDIKLLLNNNRQKISLDKKKNILNKFKQKYLYYKPKLLSQLNSPIFSSGIPPIKNEIKIHSKIASIKNTFPINKSKSVTNLIKNNNNNNNNIINNLLKTCNSLKALRDKKTLNKDILNNKEMFYEKITEELNPFKIRKIKKKQILSNFELFPYDYKKLKICKIESYEKKDREMFNDLNRQFNENITYLKNRSDFYKDKLIKFEDFLKNKNNNSNMEIYKCLE